MFSQTIFKIMTVVSLMLGAMFVYFIAQRNIPVSGEGWEEIADFGNIKLVYAAPELYADQERLAGILDTLIGRQYREYRGMYTIYFFDDPQQTPHDYTLINRFNKGEEYPFTPEQFRHFRAYYCYITPDVSEFWYVSLADTTVSPPKLQQYRAQIHPGHTGEPEWGWEPGQ